MSLLKEFESAVVDLLAAAEEPIADSTDNTTAYDTAVRDRIPWTSGPSTTPGPWLQQNAVEGAGWQGTKTTEQAKIVRDSYRRHLAETATVQSIEQRAYYLTAVHEGGKEGRDYFADKRYYRAVSQRQLNDGYVDYRNGKMTAFDLLAYVENYCGSQAMWKVNSALAREQNLAEDSVSEFKIFMLDKIQQRECTGKFSSYVIGCWERHQYKFHKKLESDNKRTLPILGNEESDNDDYKAPIHDVAARQQWAIAQRNPAPTLTLEKLNEKERRVAELYMRGQNQKSIAAGLNLSRHQVSRLEKQISKKLPDPMKGVRGAA